MRTLFVFSVLALTLGLFTATLFAQEQRGQRFPAAEGTAAEIATALNSAVDAEDATRETLQTALKSAIDALPAQSPHVETLQSALDAPTGSDEETGTRRLSDAARSVAEELSFRPLKESEVPEGFPGYTPVGMIEVKEYPVYRKASGPGFFPLFNHIKSNDIAMTAPVEMTLKGADDGEGVSRPQGMAFLYGSTEIGKTGTQGRIEVSDVPPRVAVSIGVRGRMNNATLSKMYARLKEWIAANDEWEADGEPRLMGYNSPFVPRSQTYSEVQIPIRKVDGAAGE